MSGNAILTRAASALLESQEGLQGLRKMDIMEVKSMKRPPPKLQAVLTCVAMLKGLKEPDKWKTSLKMMSDTGFVNSLMTISHEDLKDKKVVQLRELIAKEQLTPEAVSDVAEVFLKWVIALVDCYAAVSESRGGTTTNDAKAPGGSPSDAPMSTSELAWQYLRGHEFEDQLSEDAELGGAPIRLVNARYLIRLAKQGGRLVRRQDLPEEAFVPLATLRRLGLGSSNSLRVNDVLPLSHTSIS